MGLFDKVKKGFGETIGDALGKKALQAVEKTTGIDFGNEGQKGGAGSPYGSAKPVSAPGQRESGRTATTRPPSKSYYDLPPDIATPAQKAYFRSIIQDCFSDFIVREDVPVSEFGGDGKPYDFALFSRGECCGVVILVAHNRDNNRAYKGAKAAAAANAVPFINFYTHMSNERGYVIHRIKQLARPSA